MLGRLLLNSDPWEQERGVCGENRRRDTWTREKGATTRWKVEEIDGGTAAETGEERKLDGTGGFHSSHRREGSL